MKRLTKYMDIVSGAIFSILFIVIILQIFFRYVMNNPITWSSGLTSTAFIWVIFWCNAVVLKTRAHVVFDIVFQTVPSQAKRVFMICANLIALPILIIILPATFRYFQFLGTQAETTPALEISYQVVFFAYFLFAVVFPARLVIEIVNLLRPNWRRLVEDPDLSGDPT